MDNRTVVPDDVRRQLDSIQDDLARLHSEIGSMRAQITQTSTEAAAARMLATSHIAVCDERQKQMEMRQIEHDRWAVAQADTFKVFMATSSADRASLREAILVNAQIVRNEVQAAKIQVLWWVIGLNAAAITGMAGTWLKMFGPHL